MLANEAYKILQQKLKGMKAISCYEYASLYVFRVVSDNYKGDKDLSRMLNGEYSVNKSTGEVRDFKPWAVPVDEYRAGVEILDFNVSK